MITYFIFQRQLPRPRPQLQLLFLLHGRTHHHIHTVVGDNMALVVAEEVVVEQVVHSSDNKCVAFDSISLELNK